MQNIKINQPAISVCGVKKKYVLGNSDYWALKGVSADFYTKELTAIIGKSGSGKSSLLHIMGGIDSATEGQILVNSQDISVLKENHKSIFRGSNIGFVFQFFQLMPTLTALENVILPMDFSGKDTAANKKSRALNLLALVGMAAHQSKYPDMLSGGEQQRVAIARALANDAGIILADEPTGNLDTKNTDDVFCLLRSLTDLGKCVVMVTHNDDMARNCQRTVTINDGLIINDTRSAR